ncbi:MAG: hypothetical protein V4490_06520 [Pseudomonadota bacterium]
MLTLSYGFKKPQTGDKGSLWFPALEGNFQQLNDHDHNGSNSARLTSSSVSVVTQAIVAGSWVATTGGTYRQLVTIAGGLFYDDYQIGVKLTVLGHVIYPTIEKVSNTQFYIYTNDNTLDYTILYLS